MQIINTFTVKIDVNITYYIQYNIPIFTKKDRLWNI